MIKYNSDGSIKNCSENINIMFEEYKSRKFMLEKHQRKYIKNIRLFYKQRKYLTSKQFKWLEIYYNIYSGIGDIEPEPF
jgi:hypothetical protein